MRDRNAYSCIAAGIEILAVWSDGSIGAVRKQAGLPSAIEGLRSLGK